MRLFEERGDPRTSDHRQNSSKIRNRAVIDQVIREHNSARLVAMQSSRKYSFAHELPASEHRRRGKGGVRFAPSDDGASLDGNTLTVPPAVSKRRAQSTHDAMLFLNSRMRRRSSTRWSSPGVSAQNSKEDFKRSDESMPSVPVDKVSQERLVGPTLRTLGYTLTVILC